MATDSNQDHNPTTAVSPDAHREMIETLREINAPPRGSWEAIAASICFLGFLFTLVLRPSISSDVPFVLDHPIHVFVCEFVLLSLAAVLGFSSLREESTPDRLIGGFVFVLASVVICVWLFMLTPPV